MKKRIEKVVEWIDRSNSVITEGKRYKVFTETEDYYSLLNDDGVIYPYPKEHLKVVSEREVLEFDEIIVSKYDEKNNEKTSLHIYSDVDLENYDLKVIATPKDNPLESKSKEELIEIIKELKSKA